MSLPSERWRPTCQESAYGTSMFGSKILALFDVVAMSGSVGTVLNAGGPRRLVCLRRTGHDSPARTSGKPFAFAFRVVVIVAPGLLPKTFVKRSRRSLM